MKILRNKWLIMLVCAVLLFAAVPGGYSIYADDGSEAEELSGQDTVHESSEESSEEEQEDDNSGKKAELDSQLEKILQQQKEINNKIDQAQTEKDKQLALKNSLDEQIGLKRQEIAVLENRIDYYIEAISLKELELEQKNLAISVKEEEITGKEQEIRAKELEIRENFDLFKQRLRTMYMNGNTTTLGLLLGADSFSELLTRAVVLRRIAEQDNAQLESLTRAKEEIEGIKLSLDADKRILLDEKASLEEAKLSLEADKAGLESDRSAVQTVTQTLNQQVNEVNNQIHDIDEMERQFLAQKEELQAREKEIQAELDAIFREIGSTGEYVGGTFLWPVQGYSKISSYFGWRFNNTNYHTGIDICGTGIYGKPFLSANAGTVAYVGWQQNGYGNYVIVDHGGGMSTLYAHASSIAVSVGQVVRRGDTLGYVGSTGWSTGPHLHFEIRKNGTAYNPLTEFSLS